MMTRRKAAVVINFFDSFFTTSGKNYPDNLMGFPFPENIPVTPIYRTVVRQVPKFNGL